MKYALDGLFEVGLKLFSHFVPKVCSNGYNITNTSFNNNSSNNNNTVSSCDNNNAVSCCDNINNSNSNNSWSNSRTLDLIESTSGSP